MKEIRIHGRGGQGSVVTAELFAMAIFYSGKYSLAFPYLGGGGERRGAPVQAFVRMDVKPIRLRSKVHHPDYVIVQDFSLTELVDVTAGLKSGGLLLINTEQEPEKLTGFRDYNVRTVPASKIALEILGAPIMNTAIMGAFAAITGDIDIDSIKKAIHEKFSGPIADKNAAAAQKAYDFMLQP